MAIMPLKQDKCLSQVELLGIERNFGAKEQEYITDEFAIGDPVKIPETKDEKPSEKASGKEKKAKSQPER